MSSTGVYGYDGTGTASTTVTNLIQTTQIVRYLIFQNDPSSTTNIKVGFTTSPQLVLIPGQSITIEPPFAGNFNLSNFNYVAVSGNPTFNWSCGS